MMAISLSTCKAIKNGRLGESVRQHTWREKEGGGEKDMETVREREEERY